MRERTNEREPARPLSGPPHAAADVAWAAVEASGPTRHLPPGSRIVWQGDAAGSVYILKSGAVKHVRSEPGGVRDVIVALSRAPAVLGLASAVLRHVWPVSVVALMPSVMRPIAASSLERAMANRPSLARIAMAELAAELY